MLWLYTAKNSTNGFELGVLSDINPFEYVTVTGVNTGTKTFVSAGDSSFYFQPGNKLVITGSTGNDGIYTIVSSTFDTDHTDTVVSETIPSAVADGRMYLTFLIDQTEFAITGVNTGTKTFTVAGDHDDITGYIGVIGSTGNDRCYTVVSATFDTDHTDIVVTEDIASAVVDGGIRLANETIYIMHDISGVNDIAVSELFLGYFDIDPGTLICGNIVCNAVMVQSDCSLTAGGLHCSGYAMSWYSFGYGGDISITGDVYIGKNGTFGYSTAAVIGGNFVSTGEINASLCESASLTVGGSVDAVSNANSPCINLESALDIGGDLTVRMQQSGTFCSNSSLTVGGKLTIIPENSSELSALMNSVSDITAKSIILSGGLSSSSFSFITCEDAITTKRLEIGAFDIKEDVLGTGLM